MLLARHEGVADALAHRAARDPYEGRSLLESLGDILHAPELRSEIDLDSDRNPVALERALARHVGPDWGARYGELKAEAGRRRGA